ncbi:SMP-30/gluconolactonase/LRE family protein [Streptomyces tendae]
MSSVLTSVYPDRLELGEGVRWTGDELVLVDLLAGRLLTVPVTVTEPLVTVLRIPVPLGAVAPVAGRPGTWIAAAGTGICLLTRDGSPEWLARPEDKPGGPAMRMNDGVADPHGRFWAGSMAWQTAAGAGSLYRVDADGTVQRVLDGLTIPNGPAFTADGDVMYLADSARGVVYRHRVDPGSGALGAAETFVTTSGGSPDGMVVDAEGALWLAVWGTGTVRRYLPDGTLDRILRLPASQPAGVCLQDDILYVTSARVGLTAPGRHDGALFTARVDVPGRPTPSYRPAGTRKAPARSRA